MYQIKTYNAIAKEGLDEFGDNYRINQTDNPDAYLIRSVDLHDHEFPKNLKAIARCGAGYNNVPFGQGPGKWGCGLQHSRRQRQCR
ncbi:hypothetical protein ACXO2V_05515 [Lactobacillus delbrueckii subsp. bulgaricus]